jgi:tetratricopeptide (TPR) repeat protein
MIRPLSDINNEFRAEIADAPFSAQDVRPSVGNDDVADLVSTFETAPKTKAGRKPPRYAIPIAIAIVAIILIVIAGVLALPNAPAQEDASGTPNQAQDDAVPGDGADAESEGSGETADPPDPEATEYDSALESLENEINALRESEAADEGSDLSGAAALYGCVMGLARADELLGEMDAGALPPRRTLIEWIDAHFADGTGGDSPALPPDAEINSDLTFTSLTEPANALIDAINAGALSADRLPEAIDLRRRAYAIYPVRVLKKLLAIDYEDLGLYYGAAGRPAAEVLDAFVRSIAYRVEYLRELPQGGEGRRVEIRRIAGTYAAIAEIGGLGAEHRRHAAWIADGLFELAE